VDTLTQRDPETLALIDAAEAGRILGVGPKWVRQLATERKLRRVVLGGGIVRFYRVDVLALLHERNPVDWLSTRDVATRLGLSIATVLRLVAAGKLRPAFRDNHGYRFPTDELARFIRAHTEGTAPAGSDE
jgi:excisionase family DNA binding protein